MTIKTIAEIVAFAYVVALCIPYTFWSRKVLRITTNQLIVGKYDLNRWEMAHILAILAWFTSIFILILAPSVSIVLKVLLWWHVIGQAIMIPLNWHLFKRLRQRELNGTVNFNVNWSEVLSATKL